MNAGEVRKKVFLGLWQVLYNRPEQKRNMRPVQMLDIQRVTDIPAKDILNAVRFLHRHGLISKAKEGYGWWPYYKIKEVEDGCWEHGSFGMYDKQGWPLCPKCRKEM